jgi:hypothetical protein
MLHIRSFARTGPTDTVVSVLTFRPSNRGALVCDAPCARLVLTLGATPSVSATAPIMGEMARPWHHQRCRIQPMEFSPCKPNDMSRCLAALEQDSTLIAVILSCDRRKAWLDNMR